MTSRIGAGASIVCLVTNRALTPVLEQARAAAEAEVDLLQIRERDLAGGELCDLVAAVVDATRGSAIRVMVNDRIDVALACGAHGVHLRGDSVPTEAARQMTPPGFVIGRSVRDANDAVRQARCADYLIAGTVFETQSKPSVRLLGEEGLRAIAQAVSVPVLAIGGVTLEHVRQVAAAGGAGVAAIGLFATTGASLVERVRTVRTRFDSVKTAS